MEPPGDLWPCIVYHQLDSAKEQSSFLNDASVSSSSRTSLDEKITLHFVVAPGGGDFYPRAPRFASAARKRARQPKVSLLLGTITTQDSTIQAYILMERPTFSPVCPHRIRLYPRTRIYLLAIDKLLVAVRTLKEELVVIRCEKTGELTPEWLW